MKITLYSFISVLLLSVNICSISAIDYVRLNFVQCLSQSYSDKNQSNTIPTTIIHTPNNSTYGSLLVSSLQNLRFASDSTPKPDVIVTPLKESQIPHIVNCAKYHGMEIRTRSGGHDFEGLSTVSEVPFVILDMTNLRSVDVDVKTKTAWVQTGADVGELCYGIANKSSTLGYPLGVYYTIGLGGHISGGSYGTLKRKYGLGADNVIDARIVDVNGRILDRKSMGEDVFWAIRGGGGSSFGVILAWKLNLVDVPETVTVFNVGKSLETNATEVFYRWQSIAHRLPKELYLRSVVRTSGDGSLIVEFSSLYLGKADALIPIMQRRFPQLGLSKSDCQEMSWIRSVMYFTYFQNGQSLDILLDRSVGNKQYFKSKSDYVTKAISRKGIEGLWQVMLESPPQMANLILSPYGGRMSEISESAIPFPHRAGNLYSIFEQVSWPGGSNTTIIEARLAWLRKLSEYLTPYVSKNPRRSYLNYIDLDLGVNTKSYDVQGNTFGPRYFNKNFARLVQVKAQVDPTNFFKHEQSIPLSSASVSLSDM